MNIFEYAMKMETDGRQYYLDQAAKTKIPALKKVLEELADDELKHYNIFKMLRDGHSAEYKEAQKTHILATVKNVFENLRDSKSKQVFTGESIEYWRKAQEIEKEAEAFYRQKAAEVQLSEQKHILNKIADEEHKHWVTMQNVVQFLNRPKEWLEDAEWSHLEEF